MRSQDATRSADPGGPGRLCAAGFVGRAGELEALASALATPSARVLVEGEAGIGKTRLLQEYLASAEGQQHHTLTVCCPPFRKPQTLGPIADALRQAVADVRGMPLSGLAGALRPLFPEWVGGLPPAPEPAEDASMARHRLFRALEELLRCCEVRLLVAEDIHWADEATLEFLLSLASRHQPGFSLVVTCRPEDVPDGSLLPRLTSRLSAGEWGRRITLGPLDVADTAGLMSSMLSGEKVSEEFAAFVHEHTEGVPLAVEESLRLMVSRAELARHGDRWVRRSLTAINVPPTIRDAVMERAEALGPDARDILRVAAVLAEPAHEATIRAVARMGTVRARMGLSAALGCGLLTEKPDRTVAFRHALAAQAVYESIPGPDRRVLHRRAGRVLEGLFPTPAARLAHHYKEATETDKWCSYGEHAADMALASGDEASAAVLLHDLIVNAGLPAATVARLTAKIPFNALIGQDRFRELISALSSLLAAGGLPPRQDADIRVQLGQALTHMQEWPRGRAELERAIPHLGHDPVTQSRAMMLLAWPRGAACEADEHIGWLRRAAECAMPRDPADRLRLTVDRASALLALGEEGGWAEAAKIPAAASTASERGQIARSHLNFGDMALRWGRYREAGWRLSQAVEMARTFEYWRLHDNAVATRAHLDWFTGSWNGLAGRAASLARDDDVHFVTRLETSLVMGLLDAAAGARDHAEERLSLVLAETQQRSEVQYFTEAAAALARLRLAHGLPDEAVAITEGPSRLLTGSGTWLWATDLVPSRVAALAAAGRVEEAAELVDVFSGRLGGRDAPAPQAALATCRAILAEARADHGRAADLFGVAAAAWKALPRPYDALLTQERQAVCLLASDRAELGLSLLSDVMRQLSRLGAVGDADRVAGFLRGYGVAARRAWRGGRHGYGQELSPREREVVRLVLAGLTNRQIAQNLSRSPKTVAAQLNSAMRKYGVNSRTALAVKVVESGATPRSPDGAALA